MITRKNAAAAAIAAGVVLLATAPAAAVDGEVLISQAKVNAGGITPGDAPGFPATLGQRGRYKLSGNLAVPAGQNGIVVRQHDVTIDLNGFTIGSNPPGEALRGVLASAVGGLRVVNGTIAGFRNNGIYHVGGRAMVEDMRILSSRDGLYILNVVHDEEVRIRNSTIANGRNGILCDRCLIEQNVVTGNTGWGIGIYGGGVVVGNVIASNGGYGLAGNTFPLVGFGNNVLFGNNGGGDQVSGPPVQLHPNSCDPACP